MPPFVVPGAKVWFQEEWGPIVGRMDEEYHQDMITNAQGSLPTLMCAHRSIITSPRAHFFGNQRQCYNLRKEIYYSVGLHPALAHPEVAPKKLLIAQRPERWSRHMMNLDEGLKRLEKYDIEVEVVNFGSGKESIKSLLFNALE